MLQASLSMLRACSPHPTPASLLSYCSYGYTIRKSIFTFSQLYFSAEPVRLQEKSEAADKRILLILLINNADLAHAPGIQYACEKKLSLSGKR